MEEPLIPEKLQVIIRAFSLKEDSAKKLLTQSLVSPSKTELNWVIAVIRRISPKTNRQRILAAQFIFMHIIGIRLISKPFRADQRLGERLLKSSNEAISKLFGGLCL